MKKMIALALSSLVAFNSYALTANAQPVTLGGFLNKSLEKIQSQGYKLTDAQGAALNSDNMYDLRREIVLSGGDLKGVDIHLKISDQNNEELPGMILAAYRPNKERIAMAKINFDFSKGYEHNKIILNRTIQVFVKQINNKLYAENSTEVENRMPAQEEEGSGGTSVMLVFVIVLSVGFWMAVFASSMDNLKELRSKDQATIDKETAKSKQLSNRRERLSNIHQINKLSVKEKSAKLVVSKSNISKLIKAVGAKRAQALLVLVTIGLSASALTSNKGS